MLSRGVVEEQLRCLSLQLQGNEFEPYSGSVPRATPLSTALNGQLDIQARE